MGKAKKKDLIAEFRTQAMRNECELIESELAPVIRKMVDIYGKNGVKRALWWMLSKINEEVK